MQYVIDGMNCFFKKNFVRAGCNIILFIFSILIQFIFFYFDTHAHTHTLTQIYFKNKNI